jgi:hypothetical protein
VVCPRHKDANNVGRSLLVSFGAYEGCGLVVEGMPYDTRHTPHIFDGSALEHWNVPTLVGTKYSLVYYTTPPAESAPLRERCEPLRGRCEPLRGRCEPRREASGSSRSKKGPVTVLPTVAESRLAPMLAMLEKTTLKKTGTGEHRAATFGTVRAGAQAALSRASRRHPDVYEALFALGDELAPDFDFTSVHVHRNVVCTRHKDAGSVGRSMHVSLGAYEGCGLVVEERPYDTRHTPHIFDGSAHEHWNAPTLVGTKYSLVYYTTREKTNRTRVKRK